MAISKDIKNSAAHKILDAARIGDLSLFVRNSKRLLRSKGKPDFLAFDQRGNAAIHYAALHGDKDMCKYALEKLGFDVNLRSMSGKTPLCYAAVSGDLSTIAYLLDHRAVVHARDNYGLTPLHHAILGVKHEAVQLILSRGAPLEVRSSVGTPLMLAAFQGSVECTTALLSCKADPNNLLYELVSPLVIALMRYAWSSLEMGPIKELLKAGADTDMPPVLDMSYSPEVYELLKKHHAKAMPNLWKDDLHSLLYPKLLEAKNNKHYLTSIVLCTYTFVLLHPLAGDFTMRCVDFVRSHREQLAKIVWPLQLESHSTQSPSFFELREDGLLYVTSYYRRLNTIFPF